ncbi:hypothetical protein [Flagellimonas sp.]|uniref:hypothetical protein n=1 Tax=Flagellimonas sp. TaxID=2058762 RepID=UPI003B509010
MIELGYSIAPQNLLPTLGEQGDFGIEIFDMEKAALNYQIIVEDVMDKTLGLLLNVNGSMTILQKRY